MPWNQQVPDLKNNPLYLEPRVTGVESQLAEKAYNSWYYVPKTQPELLNADALQASDIYAMYDALMAKYPEYITRTLLGNDSSNTLPIYRYDFTPNQVAQKMILGANLHGNGVDGDANDTAVTLFNLMREITENYMKDDKLFFLRWKVQFIVIPVQNPWGFNNSKRQNANGVDLNRNYDYKWAEYNATSSLNPWDSNYKGTAPFSEKETQYIRDILLANKDATAYIDYHSVAGSTTNRWHYAGYPSSTSKMSQFAKELGRYLTRKYDMTMSIDDVYNSYPMGFAYAESIGITSGNPEFIVHSSTISSPHSADQMTKMLEWYGGFVWAMANAKYLGNMEAPKCSVYNTNNQAIPTGVNTLLQWNAASFNIGNMFSLANPSRLTAPVTGHYEIMFTIPFASNATGVRQVFLRKNESGLNWINTYRQAAMPTGQTVVTGVAFEFLNAGDYIDFVVIQTSGGTLNVLWDSGNGYGAKVAMRKAN